MVTEYKLMTNFKKIITHAGMFHADEVLALATFKFFTGLNIPIERKFNVTQEELQDKSILILDIGRSLNEEMGNFDHHQSTFEDATNLLVLNYFCKDYALIGKLQKHLFKNVSDVDRGIVQDQIGSFNSIIRNFNSLENGFELAIDLAFSILSAYVETAKKAIQDEKIWEGLRKENRIVYLENNHLTDWKEMAKKEGIVFAVSPNARGGFQIISVNSEEWNIPVKETQTFRHNSGFMAVYETEEEAVKHTQEIMREFFTNSVVEVNFENGKQKTVKWNGKKMACKFAEVIESETLEKYERMHTFEGSCEGSTWEKTENYSETKMTKIKKVKETVVGLHDLNTFEVEIEGLEFWLKPKEINLAKRVMTGCLSKIVEYHDR